MLIYKLTSPSNKVYIGCTTRDDVKIRLNEHIRDARNGKKYALHRAIRKYGFDNFNIAVLELNIENFDKLKILEIHYIELFKSSLSNYGYNETKGGDGYKVLGIRHHNFGKKNPKLAELNKSRTGIKLSDDHKRKVSESHITRRIRCIDTGQIFNSIKDANMHFTNKPNSFGIIDNLRGKSKSAYKHRFEYIDNGAAWEKLNN